MPGLGESRESEALWAAGMDVIRVLIGRGHAAYLVGGCVRDRLLGRPLHDIDIATSAAPEEVTTAFERTIPTGLRHGTVTVQRGEYAFEVTTFRTESGYSDARRPDQVRFVNDIREDLARRDFTINAMAFGLDGELVDPFGGRRDLERGIIRCVGRADLRFGEDALRMVRAIRFASELGFGLALSVWRGIRSQRPRLRLVAMERVGAEWDKMMSGADPERACRILERSGLLNELKEPLPDSVVMAKEASGRGGLKRIGKIRDSDLRWAAWLLNKRAGPEDGESVGRALKFGGARRSRLAAVLSFDRRLAEDRHDRNVFLSAVLDLGRATAEDWLEIRTESRPYREWLDRLPIDSAGQLAVRGDELVRELDKPPGPWVKAMLHRLLEEVAFGRLANDKDTLLQAASRYGNSSS